MTRILLPDFGTHTFWHIRDVEKLVIPPLLAGTPIDLVEPNAIQHVLRVTPLPHQQGLTFSTPKGDTYTWTLDPTLEDRAALWIGAAQASITLAELLATLSSTLPGYSARLDDQGVDVHRNGQPYARLTLSYTKDSWKSSAGFFWRGPIHGKPWTQPLLNASRIMEAFLKREKIHEPVYAFRDRSTGLYYAGYDHTTHNVTFAPKRTKARIFKRRADASGHASYLAGVGADRRPTTHGWDDAYKVADYEMNSPLSSPRPLPITCDLIQIDKQTAEETVCETGEEIALRVGRRLALQRNVVKLYGYGSTAAIDAAQQANRTDLDTLVLICDPAGTLDVRAALKAAGIGGKRSLARKATYTNHHPTPSLVTWSIAIPADAQAALLAQFPATTVTATLSFDAATQP